MSRRSEVEESIIAYLSDHPRAGDTLDGVVRWWLPRQRFETARGRIETALERMVRDGRLLRRALPDGTFFYGLSPRSTARP
jgi:hypothetical protein